ncbi:MAG: hypothetical protein K6A33_04855 [Clostridiales bacterium]|nr:hypothetical protein [Clostridiales bacterium]
MKRIYIVGLLLTAICFLGSCTRQSTDDRYHVPFLNSNQYELDFQPSDGVVYGSSFWYIQEESGAVHRLDLNDSHEDIFDTELASPAYICAADSGITVYDSSEKAVYRFQADTMELLLRVEVPAECGEVVRLDSKDGFTTVSDGLTLYLLPDEGEDWSSCSFETPIRDYRMTDRNTVVALESGAYASRIVLKDLKRNRISVLSEQNAVSLESNCGAVWMWDEGDNRIFTIRDGGAKVWYTFREGSHSLKKVMITEHNIAVLPEGEAVLYLLARVDTREAVTILTNSYGREKVTGWNEISDLPVRIVSYENEQFFDKLNTRLLAGDDDFDLVYVSGSVMDTPVFVSSFLKYGIFSDLSENERLDKNLRETTPGLMNLISYDGQYAAIPTDVFFRLFSIDRKLVSASDLEDGVVRMTMDDLWKIGDELLASGEGRGLFDQYKWIFLSNLLISELQDRGKFTEEKPPENAREIIEDFFTHLERYRDAGILEGDNPVIMLTDTMMLQDYRKLRDGTERVYVLPVGRTRGKTAVNLIGFVFVNPNSGNQSLALELLADLTDEGNRYNTKGFGNLPLYPGLENYYSSVPSRKVFDSVYSSGRATPEDAALLDKSLETIWTNSEPYTVCFTDTADNIMNAFFDGTISGGEASERLYRELIYSVKG